MGICALCERDQPKLKACACRCGRRVCYSCNYVVARRIDEQRPPHEKPTR